MTDVFVKIKDRQMGPFNAEELRVLVNRGEFTLSDLVYDEELEQWVEAGSHEELRRLFEEQNKKNRKKTVYAVGGGKGGVGKTVLTASLGIALASHDREVVIVDADFGGANLHTCMGILEPAATFYHFYTLQRESLEDICLETPVKNLRLISGACGTLGLANPRYQQKLKFIHQLHKLNADYVLLDLGAGSSYNVIDFFLAADQGILVTTPEPHAVQETFNFLKMAVLRQLLRLIRKHGAASAVLEQHVFAEPGKMHSDMNDILRDIRQVDEEAAHIMENFLHNYHPHLILNMVHSSREIQEGDALRTAAHDLLNVEVNYLGYVEYDESVRKSVKDLRPFVLDYPKSKASKSLAKLVAVGLLQNSGLSGFRERRKIIKQFAEQAADYPEASMSDNETICSVNCFYWGDCDYQEGGYPCPIRHLNPIFRQQL
ncbi:MAG: P-loop NTPase [candidate division KSB1 bacterium]|nr:P-loop NTPase [candidate division KSB1 bacterium]